MLVGSGQKEVSNLKSKINTMTKAQLSEKLNGNEYQEEVSQQDIDQAIESGLVIAYGQSDDYIHFAGSISDEAGGFMEAHAFIRAGKLVKLDDNFEDVETQIEFLKSYGITDFKKISAKLTDDKGWIFSTEIPHEKFKIYEDGDLYGEGIVFNLSDA